jgi:hypothetical protein
MRLFSTLGAAVLAAGAFLSPVAAQKVFGGQDADRKASTALVFDDAFNALGAISISYSQPTWKAEYDAKFEELKGKNLRLGKNWWTSFDTITAIEIGGQTIQPGAYYLGLHCDNDGKFSLLVLDAGKALKSGAMPFVEAAWKPDAKVPMTLNKDSLPAPVNKMEIAIALDEKKPSSGKLSIRWGKHELVADVNVQLQGAAKNAAADKGK